MSSYNSYSLPVRCHSCGDVIALHSLWVDLQEIKRVEQQPSTSTDTGKSVASQYRSLFNKYEISNYCCRMCILTSVCFFEKLTTRRKESSSKQEYFNDDK